MSDKTKMLDNVIIMLLWWFKNVAFEANLNSVVFLNCTLFGFHTILLTKIENIFWLVTYHGWRQGSTHHLDVSFCLFLHVMYWAKLQKIQLMEMAFVCLKIFWKTFLNVVCTLYKRSNRKQNEEKFFPKKHQF